MVQLKCVACGAVEEIKDQAELVRDQKCPKCGQPLIQMRAPGSSVPRAMYA